MENFNSTLKDYGSTSQILIDHQNPNLPLHYQDEEEDVGERHALVGNDNVKPTQTRRRQESIDEIMESVFSSVRSLSTEDIQADINDCDKYLESGVMKRAFPERFIALLVTLFIEIPVLLMISGGSSKLCALIGRSRYQLLISILWHIRARGKVK
mmetsp:Transcript_18444/g.27661  ORF Transcript_18444/g.27661 Transcript_18444/m.27661 type:complete len:155 (+) Transcript_18444:1069-1533(+)